MGSSYPPYHRHEYGHEHRHDVTWHGPPPSWGEVLFGVSCYLGAIVTGPVLPLLVFLARRRYSEFVRGHAAQALNVTLTTLLYAVSGTIVGALLTFDSRGTALAVMLPIAAVVGVIVVVYLVLAAAAAVRGEYRELPAWICARLVC